MVVDGRVTGDARAGIEGVGDTRLADGHRPATDAQVPPHANLPAEDHVVVDVCAAGDPDLGRHQHIAPDGDPMADLDEIVDLRAGFDARLADSRSIDGRIRTQFDVVL